MTMTMTYVFPDLHGRLDHLQSALVAIDAAGATKDDTLVFLGDYIDRGPKSAQLVTMLRELLGSRPNVVCLSGNHEFMMIWGLTEGEEQLKGWLVNGGVSTIESYRAAHGALFEDAMKDDCLWFNGLPLWHEDDHRIYVHAGVHPSLPLEEQTFHMFHWMRYENMDGYGYLGKQIVHGHTPAKDNPKTFGNRTSCDTGAVWSNRYVVTVFDDAVAGGPVRVIEVNG